MDLNKIELSPWLAAQLYPHAIVEDPAAAATAPEAPLPADRGEPEESPAGWKFLGGNQKNILVVVNYPSDLHLPDEAFTFLSQMLNACKLTPGDVAIVNLNNHPGSDHQELLNHFNASTVLLFGITPSAFGFPFDTPVYQVQAFAGQTVMHAPELTTLKDDRPAKSALWNSFKKIFNL